MGECSISIHKKSKPRPAPYAAASTLLVLMTRPMTGSPRESFCFTGFCQEPVFGEDVFLVGINQGIHPEVNVTTKDYRNRNLSATRLPRPGRSGHFRQARVRRTIRA